MTSAPIGPAATGVPSDPAASGAPSDSAANGARSDPAASGAPSGSGVIGARSDSTASGALSDRAPGPVARALTILAAFESTPGPLSVGRIVEETGLPVSTTYRLVHELQEWGVLDRTADGSYQVGMRIWELGQQAGRRLRDRAHPFMQDLFDTTHENVHLAVREGTEALYVDKLYGSRRVPLASRIGSRLPLHPTAVGRILLANQPTWFREAYLERELEHPTPKTQTEATTLARELALVREQGHAVTIDEMRLGACSIAVPISHGGQVVAAVGIVLESHRASEVPWLLNQLKATGNQIERALDRRITIR